MMLDTEPQRHSCWAEWLFGLMTTLAAHVRTRNILDTLHRFISWFPVQVTVTGRYLWCSLHRFFNTDC